MNTIIKTLRISFASAGAILALVLIMSVSAQKAHAAITSELSFGSTGNDVVELQQFLATNSFIYPAGIVSGKFGPLTRDAVVQFQAAYGISQVGRVGPQTMAKINMIIASGLGLDISSPHMANPLEQINRTGATISWTTNELALGQVYYDTMPIISNEATGHAQGPYVSGALAPNNMNTNSQSVAIQGLLPNTLYYYLTRAIDNSGNVSMTMPKTFRTNQ